jgi:hypothetical protein
MISPFTLASVQRLYRLRVAQRLHEDSGSNKRGSIGAETLQRRYMFTGSAQITFTPQLNCRGRFKTHC